MVYLLCLTNTCSNVADLNDLEESDIYDISFPDETNPMHIKLLLRPAEGLWQVDIYGCKQRVLVHQSLRVHSEDSILRICESGCTVKPSHYYHLALVTTLEYVFVAD